MVKLKVHEDGEVNLCSEKQVQKEANQGGKLLLLRLSSTDRPPEVPYSTPKILKQVWSSFSDVFLEPTTLPTKRPCDHQINLKPDSQPVNKRPYRYSHHLPG